MRRVFKTNPYFESFRKEILGIEVKPLFSRNLSLFSKEENKNIPFQKLLFLISQVDISKNVGINLSKTYFQNFEKTPSHVSENK
jgi:hypothetical protein